MSLTRTALACAALTLTAALRAGQGAPLVVPVAPPPSQPGPPLAVPPTPPPELPGRPLVVPPGPPRPGELRPDATGLPTGRTDSQPLIAPGQRHTDPDAVLPPRSENDNRSARRGPQQPRGPAGPGQPPVQPPQPPPPAPPVPPAPPANPAALPPPVVPAAQQAPAEGDDFVIGYSRKAAKTAERTALLDTLRRAEMGDSGAQAVVKGWPQAQYNSLLAELAITPDERVRRDELVKRFAVQSPGDDPGGTGLAGLAQIAVADSDGNLRRLATRALVARGDERTPGLVAAALTHEDPLLRGNAVGVLREIGGPRVFEVVIEHWKEVWGGNGARNHAFFGTVRSYVADYDISGDSYDPVVRTYFTGTVIDTKLLWVEADVYRTYIREIAGEAAPPPAVRDPAGWRNWLEQNRKALAAKAVKNRRAALNVFQPEPTDE